MLLISKINLLLWLVFPHSNLLKHCPLQSLRKQVTLKKKFSPLSELIHCGHLLASPPLSCCWFSTYIWWVFIHVFNKLNRALTPKYNRAFSKLAPWAPRPSEFGMFQESSAGCSAQGPRLQNETVLCSDPGSASRSLTWSLSAPEVVLGELTEGIRRCFNKLGRTVHLQSLGELCSEPRPLWPSLLPFPGPCPYPSARWHHAVVILKTVQIFEHNLYAGPLPSPLTLSPTLCPYCLISFFFFFF